MSINGWLALNGGEKEVIHIYEPHFYTLVVANNDNVIYSEIRHEPNSHTDYLWYRLANEAEMKIVKRYLLKKGVDMISCDVYNITQDELRELLKEAWDDGKEYASDVMSDRIQSYHKKARQNAIDRIIDSLCYGS